MKNVGILLFDDFEELDVVGPYDVFAWAATKRQDFASVFTVSETATLIKGHKESSHHV